MATTRPRLRRGTSLLPAAVTAGARRAAFLMLRLPHEVASLFEQWLRVHYPERADRVLNHILVLL